MVHIFFCLKSLHVLHFKSFTISGMQVITKIKISALLCFQPYISKKKKISFCMEIIKGGALLCCY